MDQLKGKAAIITGAAQGIGLVVADAALFLASDQSRHITGILLSVDGGRHMATNWRILIQVEETTDGKA